ncbi:alpha/beta fold hydrolase [Streptomyces sp. NBC_01304]|uniref:alpha/beta fold hydrolase n=1 Tax=Streptomyces sp. NBC_01304 TaxID=2903818 RepID=UPI002E1057F1|nr:alpha/beta hydrolase [Streptomyces sp. NBC_01304]
MNKLSVSGTSLHYARSGNGRGLVMLHGTNSDAQSSFGHVVSHFDADRTVITPDYAGCGASTIPDGDLSLDLLVEQAAAVIRDAADEPVDLLGISLGAVVAAATAATHPELVHRLVLVAGWQDSSDPRHQFVFRTWQQLEETDPKLATAFGLSHVLSPQFLTSLEPDKVELLLSRQAPVDTVRRIGLGLKVDIGEQLKKISAPTLTVGLTHDTLVPPLHSREVHQLIPNSRYAEVDSGHAVLLENPHELIRLTRMFLLDGEPGEQVRA